MKKIYSLLFLSLFLVAALGLVVAIDPPSIPVPGESYNTSLYYPDQTPSLYRKDYLLFNESNNVGVLLSSASSQVPGQPGADVGDRYRTFFRANIEDKNTSVIHQIGGGTRGYGVGYNNGKIFFVIKDGTSDAYAFATNFTPDGEFHDFEVDFFATVGGNITIDGIEQDIDVASNGIGINTTLTANVSLAFDLGGNTGNNIFASADNLAPIAALIGDSWTTGVDPLEGKISYFWLQRAETDEVDKEYELPLTEGTGLPIEEQFNISIVSLTNVSWGTEEFDSFLYHWEMNTSDYDLGSQGTTSPSNTPGTGEFNLTSWSDDGSFGLPNMTEGPDGVIAARTQLETDSRHSEIFGPLALHNVDKYYMAWTGYIDSDYFHTPGLFNGSIGRIFRTSYGDSADGNPGGLALMNTTGTVQLRYVGTDITTETVTSPIPLDEWYRAIIEYTPSNRNGEGGSFRLSVDGGETWSLETNHTRPDNYFFRIGTRSVTEVGRHWITHLSYGSNLSEVWGELQEGNNPVIPFIEYISPTPNNASSQASTSLPISVSSSTTEDNHYVFTEFEDDLLLWHRYDFLNGTGAVIDNSSYGNNGIVTNGGGQITGQFGDGYNFTTARSTIINVPNDGSLFLDKGFTISFWGSITQGNSGQDYIFNKANGSLNGFGCLDSSYVGFTGLVSGTTTDVIFNACNGTTTSTITVPTANEWHHYSIIYDEEGFDVYVDGELEESAALTGSLGNLETLQFGSGFTSGLSMAGTLDEFIILNRTLSNAEIRSLYNATANQYDHTFEDLTINETYHFQSYAIGSGGLSNQTELRFVTLTESPAPPTPVDDLTLVQRIMYILVGLLALSVLIFSTSAILLYARENFQSINFQRFVLFSILLLLFTILIIALINFILDVI